MVDAPALVHDERVAISKRAPMPRCSTSFDGGGGGAVSPPSLGQIRLGMDEINSCD
jgi:hypothetical protein